MFKTEIRTYKSQINSRLSNFENHAHHVPTRSLRKDGYINDDTSDNGQELEIMKTNCDQQGLKLK